MKEALKQILDLLQPVAALADGTPFENSEVIQRCVDASEIALEALAQPAKQEPVAWMVYTQDGQSVYVTDNPTDIQEGQRALPMYTTPPQRQPEQELYSELLFAVGKKYPNETRHQTALRYIQQAEICAVEQSKAAHNIKETTE